MCASCHNSCGAIDSLLQQSGCNTPTSARILHTPSMSFPASMPWNTSATSWSFPPLAGCGRTLSSAFPGAGRTVWGRTTQAMHSLTDAFRGTQTAGGCMSTVRTSSTNATVTMPQSRSPDSGCVPEWL